MINSVDLEYGKAADLNLHGFIIKKNLVHLWVFFQYIELRFGKVARMLLTSVYLVNMVSMFIILTRPAHVVLLPNGAILELS